MVRVLGAAVAAAAMLIAAPAMADMSAAFGNTIISRYNDGGWVKHYFNADGTYSAHWSDGKRITARWSQDGQRICLSHIRPSMLIPRFCTALVEASVGETWQARDPLGRRTTNTLVRGRQ